MRLPRRARVWLAALSAAACAACAGDGQAGGPVTLVSTHTLEDSGLLDSLAAGFRQAHPELRLRIVVAGSGEALTIGRRGDADVLLTHSPDAEAAFVRDGHGLERREVMHNDFLVLGPARDPAGARHAADAAGAFDSIRAHAAAFVSRADESGTHVMERTIWQQTGRAGAWPGFLEAGVGMADALRLASQRGAYILADRATWEVLREQLQLAAVHEGDPMLRNRYAVMLVANARNRAGAATFAAWLTGPDARRRIRHYRGGGLFLTSDAEVE